MKAITTEFIPATDTLAARVRARAHGVSPVTISHWSADDSHLEAALKLARKYGWTGRMMRGGLPNGKGDAFVFVDDRSAVEV